MIAARGVRRVDREEQEVRAGRAAADRLSDTWPEVTWVPEAPSEVWARAAIERLAELIRNQKPIFRASQKGSERGAETLSAQPFQGLLESLQNADDLRAGELRIAVRNHVGRPELLIVHDGDHVRLDHVGAMMLPWLTTKADDPHASGRFGIGQKTLLALGGPLEVHCAPFHFRMHGDAPVVCAPVKAITGLYVPDRRETLLSIPLLPEIDVGALSSFVEQLGTRVLVFLRSVRRLSLVDAATGARTVDHRLVEKDRTKVPLRLSGGEFVGERLELGEPGSPRRYVRYLVERPLSESQQRHHKATGPTTTLGVALPSFRAERTGFYDRLPLPLPSAFPFSLNAQFDPDTARSALLPNGWNDLRFRDLGELLAAVALDCFARDPASGWQAVPLNREVSSEAGEWVAERLAGVVADAQRLVADELRVEAAGEPRELYEIAYEAAQLEGLLTPEDVEALAADNHFTLPTESRDRGGRWREVVDELTCSSEVSVSRALDLFDLGDEVLGEREPGWFVGMARAAIDAGCFDTLLRKRSILLADGRRVEPPGQADPRSLVCRVDPASLAAALGLALPVHPAYLEGSEDARRVLAKLKEDGLLLEEVDSPDDALRILARDYGKNTIGRVRVSDEQLLSLRDAFERLGDEEQRRLGPRVGRNIELRGVRYDHGSRRQSLWLSPAEAYLPSAIDRETDNFARAADKTAGIRWLDGSYAKLLKRSDRRELGAQAFLVRLGVATAPRLVKPNNEREHWRRDTRPASAVDEVARPRLQLLEIGALSPSRTHLLDDRWSPDLEAVTSSIAADRNRQRRRRRALALLGVLVRAWGTYAEYQHAKAVWAYDGYWRDPHVVIATWLARAASDAWLPSATGGLRPPWELALPTEANRIAYSGRKSAFLTKVGDHVLRSPALVGLRLRRGPSATSLVAQLKEFRDGPVTAQVEAQVRTIYRLLALHCTSEGRARPVDDMSAATFRAAFAGPGGSPGLLLVDGRWRSSEDVFAGPRIFGRHRPFVPASAALEPLWRTLDLRRPDVQDCLAVLRELADGPLAAEDKAVVLETMRALVTELPRMSPQHRAQLRRLPLWMGDRWTSRRPVFAIEDEALAAQAASQVPDWQPGFSAFAELDGLIEALGVTLVRPEDFAPVSLDGGGITVGGELRRQFALAVQHLNDELARGDQPLYDSLEVGWTELATAQVIVEEELTLAASSHGKKIVVAADAHMLRGPLAFVVRSGSHAGLAEAGGRAIASLFSAPSDRQKVAWAWTSMWQRAEAGLSPQRIVLSTGAERETGDGSDALVRLQDQARRRAGRKSAATAGKTPTGPVGKGADGVQVRGLKDLSLLEPDGGTIVNPGKSASGVVFPQRRLVSGTKAGIGTSGNDSPSRTPGKHTRGVLPPLDERERLALDAVRDALRMDPDEIKDLRQRHGVGADAVDELGQFYEIKMESSAEIPNEVTLQPAQVERAQTDPDFFLAIVSGLEDGGGDLQVRFIFDPLSRLAVRIKGEVTLSGVREVEGLDYRFKPRRVPPFIS